MAEIKQFKKARLAEHNTSYPSSVQSQSKQHNTAHDAVEPADKSEYRTQRHLVTKRDLRLARARLFVRGLITLQESNRIAERIERFEEGQ